MTQQNRQARLLRALNPKFLLKSPTAPRRGTLGRPHRASGIWCARRLGYSTRMMDVAVASGPACGYQSPQGHPLQLIADVHAPTEAAFASGPPAVEDRQTVVIYRLLRVVCQLMWHAATGMMDVAFASGLACGSRKSLKVTMCRPSLIYVCM